ncbi:hypothetical protein PEC730217_36760 [Pectobacterium carotovorum subsp. carotovorum]|nr:hypothetical protein PEC730217_36760 [Pectobacterium carotovorum subsp. carotovorum]
MKFIKRLFCRHNYKLYRTLYGDEIIGRNWHRYEVLCEKCGTHKYSRTKPK